METSLPKIAVDPSILSNVETGMKTEWLVTNGLGGYASSTVLGVNTRKYHGLLVAAFNPPVDRHVLLAKLNETILIGGKRYDLGVNETKSGTQLRNPIFPYSFSIAPLPTCVYRVDQGFQLKRTIFMPHEKNASIILYEASNNATENVNLLISPLINCRNFHSVTSRDQVHWNIQQKDSDQLLIAQPSGVPSALALFSTDGRFVGEKGEWAETYYKSEAERGESSIDYNFKTGFFKFGIASGETKKFAVIAAAGKDEAHAETTLHEVCASPSSIDKLLESELKRRVYLLSNVEKRYSNVAFEDWLKCLILAADAFVVNRESTKAKSVIAGYHWFADWGRDSLISLPGLTLVLGRYEDAKQILQTFSQYCRDGLIPNAFPDNPQQTPAYNTVDATLWFFNAVRQYLKYTGDFQFVQRALWPTLQSIIDHHVNGTMFDIHVDSDGLLAHGAQLTWMDAAPDNRPVTPRVGKAVEIQALWYNALKNMQFLAHRFDQRNRAELYEEMAEKARTSFLEKFWNRQSNCLFDVIDDGRGDESIRPNQIIATSLDFTMLDKVKAELVVETVWRKLLTPFGLRTLSTEDPRYVGRYSGDRWHRDNAYHNGTVWPWLLGPFVTALLKLRGYDPHWRSIAFENFLKPLFTVELYRAGLGSIGEIFDGDSPHESKGCIAQAWSVAEPLRAYFEDVLLKRSPYERRMMEFDTV
jgi:predicted glycogen debranching enzyme